jgi:hypothetical protein
MTLTSTEMRRLEAQAVEFSSDGHANCLVEAINAVKAEQRPAAALQLLSALRQDARSNQKRAIGDVVRWIEERLREEPKIPVDRFLLELGWLRRMSVARVGGAMPPLDV